MSTDCHLEGDQMSEEPKQILTIEGLSKYLDISKSTLYKLAPAEKRKSGRKNDGWN